MGSFKDPVLILGCFRILRESRVVSGSFAKYGLKSMHHGLSQDPDVNSGLSQDPDLIPGLAQDPFHTSGRLRILSVFQLVLRNYQRIN